MIVEVVAVGTELLIGQIVNGNAATIGSTLAEAGFDAHFQQVVGDNQRRIEQALQTAMGRSDAVIMTGGIGPTQDDLTREAIAAATGRALLRNEDYAEELRQRLIRLGRDIPAMNLRMADYPEGAEQIRNARGTAPALALQHDGTWIFALPGVPEEMQWLLGHEVVPRLRKAAGGREEILLSRVVRTWGRPESWVAELLDDLYTSSSNPSIAFLASSGEIKVRITAKAPDEASARAMIAPVEALVLERMGPNVFGFDEDTIEPVLLGELERRGWTIATAESATGGMIAARLVSVPGASRVVAGGVVAYSNALKRELLGVPDETLEAGVVTEETALAMAEGARRRLGVDVAVALTGSAGPEPQEREVGTVIVAVVTPEGGKARTLRLPGDRERVRTYATTAALQLSRLAVTGVWWSE